MKTPLIGMTLEQLEQVALSAGLRKFAGGQMARRLYKLRATSLDEFTELPKAAREKLSETYCVGRTAPVAEARSKDGTVKYLFPARTAETSYVDGPGINFESVYIPDRDRATLCVSSQAGCRMGCKFCMTGRQGFHGSLTAAGRKILAQSIPFIGKMASFAARIPMLSGSWPHSKAKNSNMRLSWALAVCPGP